VTLNGVIAGDEVTASALLAFADKNAGASKTVNVSGATLSGADAGNYVVTLPATAVADILKKAINGTVVVSSKTYDGTTDTTGSITLTGVVDGDSVTGAAAFVFLDKNAGTSKTVLVSNGALSGVDAGNYSLSLPATVVADILKRALTVTADAQSKEQGASDPALTYAISQGSLVAGDALSGGLTRAVGEGPGSYAIEQGSLTASANYELTFIGNTLTITAKESPVAPVLKDQQRALLNYLETLGVRKSDPLIVIDDCGPAEREADRCEAPTKM
jgi:hypothetical protein